MSEKAATLSGSRLYQLLRDLHVELRKLYPEHVWTRKCPPELDPMKTFRKAEAFFERGDFSDCETSLVNFEKEMEENTPWKGVPSKWGFMMGIVAYNKWVNEDKKSVDACQKAIHHLEIAFLSGFYEVCYELADLYLAKYNFLEPAASILFDGFRKLNSNREHTSRISLLVGDLYERRSKRRKTDDLKKKCLERGNFWFRVSINHGNCDALFRSGLVHEKLIALSPKKERKKNFTEDVRLFKLCVASKSSFSNQSQFCLGKLLIGAVEYQVSDDTDEMKNEEDEDFEAMGVEGEKLVKIAGKSGCVDAQLFMGELFLKRDNLVQSKEWLEKAESNGSPEAKRLMIELLEKMSGPRTIA